MSIFHFQWLRRLIRKNTQKVPFHTAVLWKQRLSIVYAVLAWNAFGFVAYAVYTGRSDWAKHHGLKSKEELTMTPAQSFVQQFKMQKAKVIRISGFNTYEYDIVNTDPEVNPDLEMNTDPEVNTTEIK